MEHQKGFCLIPDVPKSQNLVIAGPGELIFIGVAGLDPERRRQTVEYARRIVEALNASPMGQEPRRS